MAKITVDQLELPGSLTRKIRECRIETVGHLCRETRTSLMLTGFTQVEIDKIESALAESDLQLGEKRLRLR